MEHRWGERFALNVPVRLDNDSWTPMLGRITDVSLSGSFIRTALRPRLFSHLDVELGQNCGRRDSSAVIPAYVVRETGAGIGVEWCEFAPAAVRALLAAFLDAKPEVEVAAFALRNANTAA